MPGVIASFAYMRGMLAGMGYPSHDKSMASIGLLSPGLTSIAMGR
jgi:hypothetical protein